MPRKDVPDSLVVAACATYKLLGFSNAIDLLVASTKEPEKVCYRAMERTSDRGLIEYGVSLRTAWVTDEGYHLLVS